MLTETQTLRFHNMYTESSLIAITLEVILIAKTLLTKKTVLTLSLAMEMKDHTPVALQAQNKPALRALLLVTPLG
tara:strand:- start:20 stop:244 length:225 start_codon:yes stop_codon:yes gene_type:complete